MFLSQNIPKLDRVRLDFVKQKHDVISFQVNDEDNLPELTSAMGGTILSLMANLWFTVTQMDSVSYVVVLVSHCSRMFLL